MSFTRSSTLFGTLVRLDESGGRPPWPAQVYNAQTHAWETMGTPARGVLYEYGPRGPEFVLTSEGDVIGVRE